MKHLVYLICLLWVPTLQAKPLVVAVQYPLAFVASTLAGEDIEIKNLTPPGVEPHEYQPGLRSLAEASRADLFLYNSQFSEPWATRFAREVSHQGGKVFVAQSVFEHSVGTHGRQGLPQNYFDPHWWLDPLLTLRYATQLAQSMIKVAPQAETAILGRLQALEQKLVALDLLYLSRLKPCTQRKLVVAHDAYQYLAIRYHLEILPLHGLSAESKPSLAKMAQVIKWVKQNHLKAIFFEDLTNPQLSLSLAKDSDVSALELSPIGNISKKDQENHIGYFELMEQNLTHLTQGLGCQTTP